MHVDPLDVEFIVYLPFW